ncbi:hypothetical protein L7F22_002739 [Adiantum nelumboides]|nr:hypothetical protein [Adiantum nelumboides]
MEEEEEIFAPYGRVENVYVIRNENKQSRGCAFVSFPEKEMAFAAISALDGVYRMAGCHQPLIVRFADPKRPRSGEGRMGNMGPNYSPHSHHGTGGPRGSGGQPMRAQSPGFGWRQGGGPSSVGLLPQTGILPLGARVPIHNRGGPLEGPNPTVDGRASAGGVQASPAMSGQVGFSGSSSQLSQQQGPHDSPLQRPVQTFMNQLPLHQQAMQSNIPHSNQMQPVQGIPVTQPSDKRGQLLVPTGQFSSAQPTPQSYGALSVSHHQSQQQFVPSIQHSMPGLATQQLPLQTIHQQNPQQSQQPFMMPVQQGQQVPPLQPLPSHLQQAMVAKEQPLPTQLQQQPVVKDTIQQPYLQPSQITTQQPVAVGSVQPSWSVPVQQQVVAPSTAPAVAVSATPTPVLLTCDWTEHTSPEGHKYYYNSSTGESRWEKPEEFATYEKQKLQQQQLQLQQQQQQHSHIPQQQDIQVQAQPQAQQLQPQLLNPQYQLASQQSYPSILQPFTQNLQPYQQQQQPQMQQIQQQHHLQLQQPQLQLQQQQQQQQQQQPLAQHQPALLQQPQPQASPAVSSVPFAQSTSGAAYQPVQAYAHMQPAVHQQLPSSQQTPAANGTPDLTRGGQWIPAAQQALPNQEWMWKSKPMGS